MLFALADLFSMLNLFMTKPFKVNSVGGTALMCAVRSGHSWIVHSLLAAGSTPDGGSPGLPTPLMVAAQLGKFPFNMNQIISMWSSKRSNIFLFSGNETIVRHLLDAGASVNTQIKATGWTALMYAANNGHVNIVQVC